MTCKELAELIGYKGQHCDTCHCDLEIGYQATYVVHDDKEIETCCLVSEYYNKFIRKGG